MMLHELLARVPDLKGVQGCERGIETACAICNMRPPGLSQHHAITRIFLPLCLAPMQPTTFGTGKGDHYFSPEESLEFLKSLHFLESLENGQILL